MAKCCGCSFLSVIVRQLSWVESPISFLNDEEGYAKSHCNIHLLATTLLPEQPKLSRSIKRMVLPIRQFYLGLDQRGSCQIGLSRFSKPQVMK
jgi:hypothetical protein